MIMPSDETPDAGGEAVPSSIDGSDLIDPYARTMLNLHQSLAALQFQVETLQDQVLNQHEQIVTLTTLNSAAKDPVSKVYELRQIEAIPSYTESCNPSGPFHDRIHTCTWVTHDESGEAFTATSATVRQAKKNCAILYLAAFAPQE